MSHQLPRWENVGCPLPSSVSVGLRWRPRPPGVPDALPAGVGPLCASVWPTHSSPGSAPSRQPPQIQVQWGLMGQCADGRCPFELTAWLPLSSDPQVPAVPAGFSVPTGSLGGHPVTLHSTSWSVPLGGRVQIQVQIPIGGSLFPSPSLPRSLSSSLDLSSHTKERGLFNPTLGPHPASRPLGRQVSAHRGEPPL